MLRHADGTLEEILHLGTPPLQTSPWWLAHLLSCPLPATVAVHITVGHRGREQGRQRRRWKRLRAAVLYKERRGQLVGSDEHEALDEAQAVDAELASEIGATVYQVGIYCAIRDPRGDRAQFQRIVGDTAREFHALTNARVVRGRRLCLPGFTATLPLGVDPLRATRSYAQRNIAHCVPLDLDELRLAERADPRVRRPRRHARADRPVRPALPPPRHARARPVRRRQDGADERAVDARDLAGDARLDHRPLLHPGPARPAPPAPGTTTRCCRWSPARGACRSAPAPAT